MNIILFGFKGVGKSYFGKGLSEKLGFLWIDTDHLLEEKYRMPVSQVYKTFGEKEFREKESFIIQNLKPEKAVISIGGGSLLDPKNREHLLILGKLIYLKASFSFLKERIPNPPAFQEEKSLFTIYEMREPLYESMSMKTVEIEKKSDQDVFQEILDGF